MLVMLLVAIVRIRLIQVPLERDEGEYAYTGQLVLQGIVPYKLAYTMKLPGTAAAYAAMMTVFGQTTTGIHTGLLVVNIATILLVFLLARKLFDAVAGVAAAACYGLMSTSPSVLGLAAHATHFVVFFAVLGIWLLLCAEGERRKAEGRRQKAERTIPKPLMHPSSSSPFVRAAFFILHSAFFLLFASGLCFGLAILMKQHGLFYGLFALAFLLWTGRSPSSANWKGTARRAAAFCAALMLPVAAVCLLMYWTGAFGQFVFWTFTYARQYAVGLTPAEGWLALHYALPRAIGSNLPLWILSLAGLVLALVTKPAAGRRFFLVGFLLSSALAVCPGLYFRPHYFILLLPALALLAGAAVSLTGQLLARCPWALGRRLPVAIFGLLLTSVVLQQRVLWFSMSPLEVCRELYGHEPFPESVGIAEYLRQHTAPTDPIAVLGSEPQIYFYARRHSATGYLYTFPLMESHPFAAQMQDAMIREIEQAKPKYIVYVQNPVLWLIQTNSPTRIFDWAAEYLSKYYVLDGMADPVERDRTEYRWGPPARDYKPESEFHTLIYARLQGAGLTEHFGRAR
jgi:hypothetical protein